MNYNIIQLIVAMIKAQYYRLKHTQSDYYTTKTNVKLNFKGTLVNNT